MFLLIRHVGPKSSIALETFTFHYVSINTWQHPEEQKEHLSLHSTMFLLILEEEYKEYHALNFTFHYVSINTVFRHVVLIRPFFLYIPLCFY